MMAGCFEQHCTKIYEFIKKWESNVRIDTQYLTKFFHEEINEIRSMLCVLVESELIEWKNGWKTK